MERLSIQRRLEFGVVGGFIGSVASEILLTAFGGVGLFPYPVFVWAGQSIGLAQASAVLGIAGLMLHLTVGLVCGLVFAFIFRRYTPMMGIGFAWVVTIGVMAIFLFGGVPRAGVDAFQMSFGTILQLVLGVILANSAYGILLGFIGSRYVRQSKF
jgi:hypothetical protein